MHFFSLSVQKASSTAHLNAYKQVFSWLNLISQTLDEICRLRKKSLANKYNRKAEFLLIESIEEAFLFRNRPANINIKTFR